MSLVETSLVSDVHSSQRAAQSLHCHARSVAQHLRSVLANDLGARMYIDSDVNHIVWKVLSHLLSGMPRLALIAISVVEWNAISTGRMSPRVWPTVVSLFVVVENEKKAIWSIENSSWSIKRPIRNDSSIRYRMKLGLITVSPTIMNPSSSFFSKSASWEKRNEMHLFSSTAGEKIHRHRSFSSISPCSAGIGRTGVLILMETALCLIESNQAVFPLAIVRQMREQRLGMIQTAVRRDSLELSFVLHLRMFRVNSNSPVKPFSMLTTRDWSIVNQKKMPSCIFKLFVWWTVSFLDIYIIWYRSIFFSFFVNEKKIWSQVKHCWSHPDQSASDLRSTPFVF